MAEAVGLSLNTTFLKRLEEAEKLFQNLIDKNNQLSSATVKAFQTMTQKGIAPYVDSLREQKVALEGVAKVRLGKNATQEMRDMKDSAKAAVKEINNLINSLTRTKQYRAEASGATAISFSRGIINSGGDKSINNMERALSKMREAQNRLNLNTVDGRKAYRNLGKEINKVNRELNKARQTNRRLSDESRTLGKNITAAFAVNAIRTFAKQLVAIRGEFEMQHRSLQVLLQDVDKANELWDKTVSLAVKSPFRVKELVTYTKQLAAYRIEADKLYETNRMLADVSAGLGVDMNRLILAFGQVKAANYLRGTELRQFSEAGVNLLGELAKRFSELEGRAVSVGDVFERVSKRMVSFADVEAVFQTITGEGGVFYQMQEKQSETLKGLWMNLQDSIDLMFNEIGSNNEGALKGVVRILKEIVDNWRKMIPLIEGAGVAFAIYFSVSKISNIGRAISRLAHPWAAVVGVVVGLGVAIYEAITATNKLNAAMGKIDKDITSQLTDSISLYRKLAEQVKDVTLSEKEHEKALKNLQSKFKDILPDQMLELDYIKGISDNYDAATEAMMNYYNAKAIEQKKDKVESLYAEELEGTDIPELKTATTNLIETLADKKIISQELRVGLLSGVSSAVEGTVRDVKAGKVNVDRIGSEIRSRLEKYVGGKVSLYNAIYGDLGANVNELFFREQVADITETLKEYVNAMRAVQGLPLFDTFAKEQAANFFLPEKENIESVKQMFKDVLKIFDTATNEMDVDWEVVDDAVKKSLARLPKEAEAYKPALEKAFDEMKKSAQKGRFEFIASLQGTEANLLNSLPEIVVSQGKGITMDDDVRQAFDQLVDNMNEKLKEEAKALDLTPFQTSLTQAMRIIAKETGVGVNEFTEFIPLMGESVSKAREEVAAKIGLLDGDIKHWEESQKAGLKNLDEFREGTLDLTEEEVENSKKLLVAFKLLRTFLGDAEKGKKKTDTTIEEKIKVVDQMNAKFHELNNQGMSAAESLQGAFDAYKDAFATAYNMEHVRTMSVADFVENVLNFPNEDEVIKWLDELAKTVDDKEDKIRVQLAKGKFEMDVEVRAKKLKDQKINDDIKKFFDQYDSTVELKALKIPKDAAKNFFNVEYLGIDELKNKVIEKFSGTSTELESELKKPFKEIRWDFVQALVGKPQMEQIRSKLSDIIDLTNKENEESAKRFVKFLTKNLDEKKVALERKGMDIAFAKKMFDEGKISAEGFAEVVKNISEQTNEEISKINLDKFKESPEYIQAMGDLTAYSITELEGLKAKLQELISANGEAFSAEEMLVYQRVLEKIGERIDLLDDNLWFKDSDIKTLQEIKRIEGDITDEKKKEADATANLTTLEAERAELVTKLSTLEKQREDAIASKASTEAIDKQILDITSQITTKNEEILKVQGTIKKSKTLLAELGEEMDRILDGQTKAMAKVGAYLNIFNKSLSLVADTYQDIKEVADSFGADTESLEWKQTENAISTLQGFGSNAASAVGKFASGDIFGGIMDSAKAIKELIVGINKAYDDALEDTIQKHLEDIESLQKDYEKLEWVIDRAFSFDKYGMVAEQTKNLGKQIENTSKAIALEEDKKDTDEERIKELRENAEEARRQIHELYDNLRQEIVGSYEDLSSTLADAMIEALKNGEDALKAWGDEVDNIIANIVTKLMVQKYVEPQVSRVLDQFYNKVMPKNAAAEKAFTRLQSLTVGTKEYEDALAEWERLNSQAIGELPQLTESSVNALKNSLNAIGVSFEPFAELVAGIFGGQGGGLSALEKGIQGVTEQTAQVLEALLNSMRDTQANSYSELQSQTNLLRDIKGILNDLTSNSPRAVSVKFA